MMKVLAMGCLFFVSLSGISTTVECTLPNNGNVYWRFDTETMVGFLEFYTIERTLHCSDPGYRVECYDEEATFDTFYFRDGTGQIRKWLRQGFGTPDVDTWTGFVCT